MCFDSIPLFKLAGKKNEEGDRVRVVAASRELTTDDRFKCEVCGATFTHHLPNHDFYHRNLKPHKACCGKSFVTNAGRERHQQKCSKCQETTPI